MARRKVANNAEQAKKALERWKHAQRTFGFGRCPLCRRFAFRAIYMGTSLGCCCSQCVGPKVSSAEVRHLLVQKGFLSVPGA